MTIRERVSRAVPEGAFLRRDRSDALYITNAPMKGGLGPLDGFIVEEKSGLARIFIAPDAMESLADEMDLPDDSLSRELSRFNGASPEAARLFTDIIKAMENPAGADVIGIERRLRQAAALALRAGGGAGLYHCARALCRLRQQKPDIPLYLFIDDCRSMKEKLLETEAEK